jgi:CRP-like cAMP-binding protein
MSDRKLFTKVVRAFPAGTLLFKEGDPWTGLYCIQSGQVSVYKTHKTSDGEQKVELAKLGAGALIGEMGLFEKTKRDASVQALEYTEILVISREMFDQQMAKVPPWMVNLFKLLTQRLRVSNERLLDLTQTHAQLAAALEELAKAAGKSPEDLVSGTRPQGKSEKSQVMENPFSA